MANCNHDCNSCKSTCSKKDFLAPMNAHSRVKKVIGVVSGKGGVGKSSVTSLLALAKQREGYKVAILDGDITGPSIGRIFGVENKQVLSNGKEFTPVESSQGIKIMSTNLLLESNDTPVIWRGPVLAGMIKQFWSDVMWGDVDYMFVDMPPGTGDVPLTVFQSLPLDGIIIVTSPQELVGMIVSKAVNMAKRWMLILLELSKTCLMLNVLIVIKRFICLVKVIVKKLLIVINSHYLDNYQLIVNLHNYLIRDMLKIIILIGLMIFLQK